MVTSGIVFWKKLYCFEEDLWWNTFQNPLSIQWYSKLNTGDVLGDPDVEHSFEILSAGKKNNASVFRAILMKKIFITQAAKKTFLSFQYASLKPS